MLFEEQRTNAKAMDSEKKPKRPRIGIAPEASVDKADTSRYEKVNYPEPGTARDENSPRPRTFTDRPYQQRSYSQDREGGYNQNRQGYQPRQTGYSQNRQQGGYGRQQYPYNQGYNQGYRQQHNPYQQNADSNAESKTAENKAEEMQHSEGRPTGYNQNRQGGYNQNRQGGYQQSRQSGYNQNRQSGYNQNRQGG